MVQFSTSDVSGNSSSMGILDENRKGLEILWVF